jgi:hypothetical protein
MPLVTTTKLVVDADPDQFVTEVNALLARGWQLYGSPFTQTIHFTHTTPYTNFCQMLTWKKRIHEEEEDA